MLIFEWVMSVDFQGKWLNVSGLAQINLMEEALRGELKLSGDDEVYHYIDAYFYDENAVNATITSDAEGVEPFTLHGNLFCSQTGDEIDLVTLVLTDGTTVLSLTHGPRSGN